MGSIRANLTEFRRKKRSLGSARRWRQTWQSPSKLRDGCEIIIERVSSNDKRQIFQQFLNEILVSNILHHKNLVTFRGYAFHHEKFLVAHEYLSNGTLAAYLECEIQHNKCTLPLLTRMEIAIDIANALSYLHKHGIIHHNINSSNILLDKSMCAKVAGLHLSVNKETSRGCRVSYRSDVYSFGAVLFELISSKPAFWREVPHGEAVGLAKFAIIKLLNNTLKELVDPDIGYDSDKDVPEMVTAVAELAFQCIQCPKELRPSMKQVLETLEGIKKGTWGFNQII
ncbi:LEAF RUST 10 DISEASE-RESISTANCEUS RECEPTOR-LIKE PROTEIN KINASE-like 1.2 [Arachis hypogaea]|uniref:LEAF RUST 10 DISEASE-RESISTANCEUS RECEPTOR-LIKE PROTEIN KINASE-like 1.2 n=1 Tax=Arachis hypogaea TaxID=3818 RepID=UPI0010FC5F17|nr:LEAF RUST 10 DISEASE-RESISTANCE LOCUS RECEPTOR-LIKE PROTEIN KINASE-like 1.2 [Arachis hypogaea]